MDNACIAQLVGVAKDVVIAGTAAIGAWVAVRGLNTWNRQLKGGIEYELTRRLLRTTYRLREAIRSVRNPMMWAAEMPAPPEDEKKAMTPEQIHYYGRGQAYQLRWDKVTEVRNELQTELLEGEVLWGDELHKKYEILFKLQQELFSTIHMSLLAENPHRSQQAREATQQALGKRRDVMYDLSGDKLDEFSQELAAAILAIEDFLKPHLRK